MDNQIFVLMEECWQNDDVSFRNVAYFTNFDEAYEAVKVFSANFPDYRYYVETVYKANKAVTYWEAAVTYDPNTEKFSVVRVESLVGLHTIPHGYILGKSGYGYGATSWEALENAFKMFGGKE